MLEEIKKCIEIRTNFFEEYFTVPEEHLNEKNDFVNDMISLGENCSSAVEFEEKFASVGLSERFNAIIPKCVPKQHTMTAEEKQYSREVAKQIFEEDKERIIKESVEDVADSVMVAAESEMISQRRKAMIAAGTFDEYTRVSNAIDDTKTVAGFFGKLFKKKNKENQATEED